MSPLQSLLKDQLRINRRFGVQFVSIVVGAHGIFILATTLLDQVAVRHGSRLSAIVVDVPLLIGLSLLYLSTLLRRRKRTAWLVTIVAYSFYLGIGVAGLRDHAGVHDITALDIIRRLVLPGAILGLLFLLRAAFVVQSDIQGFRWAARFSLIMLFVALIYGVAGFSLMDHTDFHQEISVPTALHYTLDQFDLTTSHPIRPYTKRAKLFVGSLSVVSLGAALYVVISMFQPLRLRLGEQTANRQRMAELLAGSHANSEDFFKLWPHDKQYFFDIEQRSGLAFHVYRGVALCLGDPAGDKQQFSRLLNDFSAMCFGNDWTPAFIHVPAEHRKLYTRHGLSLQKIGQEAVLDIERFRTQTAINKYFRHIRNKFTKQGYSCELLTPPHHAAVVDRLTTISEEWRRQGGHVERGFAMGYFSAEYMQLCPIMVVRDAAGTIQAFVNQLPAEFDKIEANFDLLRHTQSSPGNINDFLLINFIEELAATGYQKLNMGLCPLTGLEETEAEKNLLDSVLRFAYANGDRFYSFSGLYRFKAKYEPEWRDRYIAYQGGLRGFSRVTNALMQTMRVKTRKTPSRGRK